MAQDSGNRRELELDHSVSAEVSQHVRSILGDAEAAANAIQHEAEQHAQARRRQVEEEAREILANARRDAEALVEQRVRRIGEISDEMLTRAESLSGRIEHADTLKRELEQLVSSLGGAAQQLRRDAGAAAPAAASPEPAATAAEEEVEAEPVADAEPVEEETAGEPVLRAVPDSEAGGAPAGAQPAGGGANGGAATIESDDRLAARLVALQMAVAGGNRAEVEGHLQRAFDIAEPGPILDDVFGAGTGGDTRLVSPETAGDGA